MDDLDIDRLMAEAAPPTSDEAFLQSVREKLQPRVRLPLSSLLESAVILSGLALGWKGLERLPTHLVAELALVQTLGAAVAGVILLALMSTRADRLA